jgi:hypothetical protein
MPARSRLERDKLEDGHRRRPKMSKMPKIMVSLRSVFSLSSFAFQLRNILAQYAQN